MADIRLRHGDGGQRQRSGGGGAERVRPARMASARALRRWAAVRSRRSSLAVDCDGSSASAAGGPNGCLVDQLRSTDHGRRSPSYDGLADIFGVYLGPDDGVYLVPVGAVADFERLAESRADPQQPDSERVRIAVDFEIDRWTIDGLRQVAVRLRRSELERHRVGSPPMDLSVTFLGTGGSVPSARRSTASVLIARGGERLLFDCGEGTQRQMQRSLGLVQVDEIYLTHFHADHILGLPGLLKTYDLTDRERPLTVYGPPRAARALHGARAADRAARLRARAGRAGAGRGGRSRRLRDPALRGRAQRARQRLRAGRGRAARAASTPRRRSASASPKARPSPRCSAGRRSRAAPGRSPRSR